MSVQNSMRAAFALLALATMLSGCSGRPPLGQVTGTVTLDDQPIAKGTVTFEAPGQRPATARIENGQIVEPMTFDPGDGVPVGSHRVAIAATEAAESAVVPDPGQGSGPGASYMSGKSLIPAVYNDPTTSGLTATIKSGKNTVDFKLKSQGP